VLKPAQICVELVAWNEAGSDPAGDRPQFVVTDQRANVVLGAAELRGNLANRQGRWPLHEREYREVWCHSGTLAPASMARLKRLDHVDQRVVDLDRSAPQRDQSRHTHWCDVRSVEPEPVVQRAGCRILVLTYA
jgi:hypothetical protein